MSFMLTVRSSTIRAMKQSTCILAAGHFVGGLLCAVEQYIYTVVLFVFQLYPVCNLGQFINCQGPNFRTASYFIMHASHC